MTNLKTLAQAAGELGLSPGTLRVQRRKGRLRAELLGSVYVVSDLEIARYRVEHLGNYGRPPTKPNGRGKRSVRRAELQGRLAQEGAEGGSARVTGT